jgi:hypothetical protein
MGIPAKDMVRQSILHPLVTAVGWRDDNHRQRAMDAMMMLLAKRDFTTDLAGLWLSNLLAHFLVLPDRMV